MRSNRPFSGAVFLAFIWLLFGCNASPEALATITVSVQADGSSRAVTVSPGTSVQAVLQQSGIPVGSLDRVDPPTYTLLTGNSTIQITRIREEFETQDVVIPFERQTVRNESLPEGRTMLIQPGVNGVEQVTYRTIFEDDVEVSRGVFKNLVVSEALPEIIMVGVQSPFTPLPIPGRLVYIASGNAWLMEGTTGARRPLVTTGDLDGRIFSLSPKGDWLLYTRKTSQDPMESINTLWAVPLEGPTTKAIDLRIKNVVHFAAWVPGAGLKIAYSTVEPRETAPGWQANNDLHLQAFNNTGMILDKQEVIGANTGGIYGWWGTDYAFSGDASLLAYARPDSIGLVDLQNGQIVPMIDLIPLQTRSDWAWVPSLGWSPDSSVLYSVNHAPMANLTSNENSPIFDLVAVTTAERMVLTVASQSGMFTYPVPSYQQPDGSYQVAYLQAIFPEQSETSRYRLILMDRDGSNRSSVFPPEGSSGLKAQRVVWSPPSSEYPSLSLAFLYQDNIFILNLGTGQAQQVTGDGSIGRIDWK